jgi:serine/threonine protein kinase/tetratricopeptide (TPR) repeat protein
MRPGDTIDHRFQVELEVAAGGMGRIFRANDLQTGQPVAIKVLGYRDPRARDRFLQEARMLAEIRHPGIVRYIAHGMMGTGSPYLVMEWLEGENLAQYLERLYTENTPAHLLDDPSRLAELGNAGVTIAQALQVGRRLASAVGELHKRGFVHRDIKPANLLLAGGSIEHVKLIDFGTVRHAVAGQPSEPGRLIGTPFYMSPEQARSDGQIGPPTDVWAIGCVLYECLTGFKAFWADNVIVVLTHILMDDPPPVQHLRPEIPDELAGLVMKSLSKAPENRPADARALAEYLEHLSAAAGPVETAPRLIEWPTGSAPVVVPHTLTEIERRVSCLVFAGHPGNAILPDRRVLAEAVRAVGADLERLANGTLLITIPGTGAPTDQATRAARAAMALRQAAPALSMVLATGRVEGPRQIPQVRVLTQAARALQNLPPGTIRVDALTASLLDHRFHVTRDQDGGYLITERPHESTRTLLGKPTRWVGRQRELDTLLATFDECVEDEVARAVLVTAPAGMGKSRLRYELERALRDQGHQFEVLRGQGDAVAAGSPFIMLAPAIRRLLGIRDGEPIEERRNKLERRLAAVVAPADRERIAMFLGEMIGVPHAKANESLRAARKDPMLLNQLMQKAWEDWLAAECKRSPVLLLLEDLHWGDLPSVTYVDGVLRSLQDAPFMVLALARPEIHNAFPNLWAQRALSEVPLHPLSRKASMTLVRDALGDKLPGEVAGMLIDRAGGNAFYLEELIRAMADTRVVDSQNLPDTIVGMVHARLDALGAEAKRVLRAASVFGKVFWDGGVRALLGDTGVYDAREWLHDLVAGEIVIKQPESRVPGNDEYAFRHGLVREGAYAMLTVEDRRLGHRLAAAWLERSGERDQLVLAEHFMRGGDSERAIPYFQRAAAQSLESNDLRATVARAEKAIIAGAQGVMLGALRSLQSVASYWLSDYASSRRYGQEAAELLPQGSVEWFAAVGSALVSSSRLGDSEQVDQLFHVALSATCAPGAESAQIICLCRGTFQLVFQGHLEQADQILPRIEILARQADERGVLDALTYGQVRHLQSMRATQSGNPTAYLPHLEAAVAAFERAGDLRNVSLERTTVAWTWAEIGFLDRAADLCRSNLEYCLASGTQQAVTYAKVNLGYILSQIDGRRSEARKLLEEAITECHEVHNARQEGWARAHLSALEHDEGQHAVAEQQAAQAVALLATTPSLHGWALAVHGRVLLTLGRPAEALERAREAMALLERLGGLLQGITLPPLLLAQALEATGDTVGARAAMVTAIARLQRRAATFTNPECRARFLALRDNRRTIELATAWGIATGDLTAPPAPGPP